MNKRTHKTRALSLLGGGVMALLAATACSSAPGASSTKGADTIVIAAPVGVTTLDPSNGFDVVGVGAMVWSTVYDTLVTTTVSGEIQPRLAVRWTVSPDAKTYTFTLREGVKFQNGDPLDAEDVVYTFAQVRQHGVPQTLQRVANVNAVEAHGPTTVEFQLKNPDNAFLFTVGDPAGLGVSILDRRYKDDPGKAPMGSGPFKFVSYAPNSALILERNDSYWNRAELPSYKRIEVRVIPEDASQVAALKAGAVSLIQPTSASTVVSLGRDGSLATAAYETQTFWISLSRVGKTAPPAVARAVALAVDRDALSRAVYFGQARPGSTASPAVKYALPLDKLPNYKRDVSGAKALLADAGYPKGIDLNFTWPVRAPFQNNFFEVLQSSLAEAGIRLTLQPVEQSVWLSKFLKADYDLSATDQSWYPNPIRYVLPRPGWQAPPDKVVPELQSALDQYQAATPEQRPGIFQKIQLLEATNVYPFIGTVWIPKSLVSRKDRVRSVQASALVASDQRSFFESIKPA